jgi:hypothetical protein
MAIYAVGAATTTHAIVGFYGQSTGSSLAAIGAHDLGSAKRPMMAADAPWTTRPTVLYPGDAVIPAPYVATSAPGNITERPAQVVEVAGTSISADLTGCQTGDLVVVQWHSNIGYPTAGGTGWTVLTSANAIASSWGRVYYRVLDGTADDTLTFTAGSGQLAVITKGFGALTRRRRSMRPWRCRRLPRRRPRRRTRRRSRPLPRARLR